jgi:hypothetical protein
MGLGRAGHYIESHLDALHRKVLDNVVLPVFCINTQNDRLKDIQVTRELIDKYRPYDVEPQVVYRANDHWSYGAWQEAIIWLLNNRPDIKYAMLIEDDYLPVRPDFAVPFIQSLKHYNGAFCCQYIWLDGEKFVSASISNGMIDLDKARTIFNEHKCVFMLSPDETQWSSQRFFVNLMANKYPILGLNNYTHPFSETYITETSIYKKELIRGGTAGVLLRPLE